MKEKKKKTKQNNELFLITVDKRVIAIYVVD